MSSERLERSLEFDLTRVDQEARTIGVTVATTAAIVGRTGMPEVLEHTPDAVDLSRAREGLPLLLGHDRRSLPIGRVTDVRLDGDRTMGIARFGASARANDVWPDVMAGIVRSVSVGADVDEWLEADGRMLARRWRPVEVSIVGVGADPAAVMREDRQMEASETTEARADGIRRLYAGLDSPDMLHRQIEDLSSEEPLEMIRSRLMDHLKGEHSIKPLAGSVSLVADQVDKSMQGLERWLEHRAGLLRTGDLKADRDLERELRASPYSGMTLADMARSFLEAHGVRPSSHHPFDLVHKACTIERDLTGALSTGSFTNLLANTAAKSLGTGFDEAPETWRAIASTVPMSNFNQHTFPVLSSIGDIQEVHGDGELKHVTATEKVENLTLRTFAGLFGLTRRAIVNDDLSAFSRIPAKLGMIASRNVGDLVYTQITSNPTMNETSRAVFNTTDNTQASAGAAISTTTLDAGWTAMATKTDPGGATLNLTPSILLVPKALASTARVQIASEKDPGEGATTSFDKPNAFQNAFSVVSDARLDANSTTAWYLLEQPGRSVDTIAVGFLNGVERPTLDSEEGFTRLGITYRVVHDAVAGWLDFRGAWKNAGA